MDHINDAPRVTLQKLSATNYHLWSNKMEVLLRGRGLWRFVDGAQRAPVPHEEAHVTMQKKDQAISLLLMSIADECIAPVICMRDPKDIWDTLSEMYKATSAASVDSFVVQYQSLRMQPSEKVMQYVNRMKELENKLMAVGHAVKDAEQKRVLLRGLRDEFAVTAGVIRATNKSLQEAIGLLVIQEADSSTMDKSSTVKTEQAFPVQRSNRDRECYFCGQKGHIKINCFKNPKSRQYKGDKRGGIKRNEVDSSKDSLLTFIAGVVKNSDEFSDKWFVDSGASAHMCNSQSAFSNLKKEQSDRTVSVGDGTPLTIMGQGSVRATTVVGGTQQEVLLQNVLFVPKLCCNLISVSACRKNDVKVTFDSAKNGRGLCTAEHSPTSRKVFTAVENKENGLFEAVLRSKETLKKRALVVGSDTSELWHLRLGHASSSTMEKTIPLVQGMCLKKCELNDVCETCELCKSRRHPRPARSEESKNETKVLDLVHCDVQGPISIDCASGARYFIPLLDDASGLSMVRLLRSKDGSAAALKEMIAQMEKTTGRSVKRLRSDNATELLSKKFQGWLREKGITHEKSPAYSPESNGKAERVQQTIMTTTRCLLEMVKSVPDHKELWDEAVLTANYLRNRMYSTSGNMPGKTPYEAFTGRKPDLSVLRVYGSKAFVHVPKEKRKGKLSSRSTPGILVGYSLGNFYRVLITTDAGRSVVVSKDVRFDESGTGFCATSNDDDHSAAVNEEQASVDEHATTNAEVTSAEESGQGSNGGSDSGDKESQARCSSTIAENDALTYYPNLRRSERVSRPPERFDTLLVMQCQMGSASDPLTIKEALCAADAAEWQKAMEQELLMIKMMGTWKPAFLPKGKKTVKTKWVFHRKVDSEGNVTRHRARLVAKGFSQTKGMDYDEVFAPVAKYTSLRFLLALKVLKNYSVLQLDVKNAFLNGILSEEIYLEVPHGVDLDKKSGNCFRLRKALYGLKQAARVWHEKLDCCLTEIGFKKSSADPSLYFCMRHEGEVYLLVYVDDVLLVGSYRNSLRAVADEIAERFDVRMNDTVDRFLGITCEFKKDEVIIHSASAVARILQQFGMRSCRTASTPLPPGTVLDKTLEPVSDEEKTEMQKLPYRELVGSLLYLANTTRPDIAYVIGLLSRYMENPGKAHWTAGLHVLRYLSETIECGIRFRRTGLQESNCLVGFSDADFAGDRDERKSTSGYVFMLAGGAICWSSKKQSLTAQSTVEAELIALSFATREVLWLRKLALESGLIKSEVSSKLFVDNQGCIALVQNEVLNERTKHIDVKFNLVKDKVRDGTIILQYLPSALMAADILTKVLNREKHRTNLQLLGMVMSE